MAKKSLNWLPFLYITEFTADKRYNDKNLLPSLLKCFTIFKINIGGIQGKMILKKNTRNFSIRCSNFVKETIIDVDNLDKTYQEIITTFLLNTMLHCFGML